MTPHPSRSRAQRSRQGFTLIEMMVALAMGSIVVATVFTIGASSSRHFQEQQRISQLQLSVRLALDRVRRDAQRAAFQSVRFSGTARTCGPAPAGLGVRGVVVTDRSAASSGALAAMPGWTAAASHGDLLSLSGNFRTGDNFLIREWNGTQMQLQTSWHGYQRAFTADPNTTNIDSSLVERTFARGTTLLVRAGGGQHIWTESTAATASGTGNDASITTSPGFPPACSGQPGIEGWCQNGCTVAPITRVDYEILPDPGTPGITRPLNVEATGVNTVLMRTERNVLTGAILDGPTRILDYAVHFDVDVVENVTVVPGAPMVLQIDDDGAATDATTARPDRIRALRISLAARTPEHDEHLTSGVANLPDGTPRVFQVFAAPRPGAARVRSAYTEVFLPNMAF